MIHFIGSNNWTACGCVFMYAFLPLSVHTNQQKRQYYSLPEDRELKSRKPPVTGYAAIAAEGVWAMPYEFKTEDEA